MAKGKASCWDAHGEDSTLASKAPFLYDKVGSLILDLNVGEMQKSTHKAAGSA